MKYFVLNPLADAGAGQYCFCFGMPKGIATRWNRLMLGKPFENDYPADPDEVTMALGADYPGLVLPSFLGNTTGALAVDARSAEIIFSHHAARTERLPFVLLDHKQRVYSRDYAFLNPLEKIFCLHETEGAVRRNYKGEIKEVTKLVLDKTRIDAALDLFRLGEQPSLYLFSEPLVADIQKHECTNFHFKEVPVA